jgi:DMSO/TMAO reductase YedYZ molybdopterin-dependent catalytic subunit
LYISQSKKKSVSLRYAGRHRGACKDSEKNWDLPAARYSWIVYRGDFAGDYCTSGGADMSDQHGASYEHGEPRSPHEVGPDVIISPDTLRDWRLPPLQSQARKWPVLHYWGVPDVDLSRWQLEVLGLVERPVAFTWEEFQQLPRVQVFADFHCVTRWSKLGNLWEGVSARELVQRAGGVKPEAAFVVAHSYDDGYTTNMPLADFLAEDVLLADRHDGEPLTAEHGGPLRLVVPRRYAWKSAKWLRALEVVAVDQPGTWEQAGYHPRGDPWTQERHRW